MNLWRRSAVDLKKRLKAWRGLYCGLRLAAGILTAVFGVAGPANADGRSVGTVALSPFQSCDGQPSADQGDVASRLIVRAWYPMEEGDARKAADVQSPVLFFNASWAGSSDSHQDQFHELVMHGFVVISVDHRLDLHEYDQFLDFSSDEAFKRTKALVDDTTRRFAADNIAVLDALRVAAGCTASSDTSSLAHRLDFDRVGIFGYSFGGAVAAQTAWLDPRFKAALNMDGWLFAEASIEGIRQPFMEMSDATPVPTQADIASEDVVQRLTAQLNLADYNQLRANMELRGGYYLVLTNSNHQSFMDISKRSIVQQLKALLTGPRRLPGIINAYVTGFFERYLMGIPSDLIGQIPSPYDEVRLEFAKPPTAVP